MGLSGIISYSVAAIIGLSLLGLFGDARNYLSIFGISLIVIFIWWVLRRVGIIPAI